MGIIITSFELIVLKAFLQ